MATQDYPAFWHDELLLPPGMVCCPAAESLAQLQKVFEQMCALQREHVARICQLEESCAWLLSQNEKLRILHSSNINHLQNPVLSSSQYSTNSESSCYTIGNSCDWQVTDGSSAMLNNERAYLSYPLPFHSSRLEVTEDEFPTPAYGCDEWIEDAGAEYLVYDKGNDGHRQTSSLVSSFATTIPDAMIEGAHDYLELHTPLNLTDIRADEAMQSEKALAEYGIDKECTANGVWGEPDALLETEEYECASTLAKEFTSVVPQLLPSQRSASARARKVTTTTLSQEAPLDEEKCMLVDSCADNNNSFELPHLYSEMNLSWDKELSLGMMDLKAGFNTSSAKWGLDSYILCLRSTLRRTLPLGNVDRSLLESVTAEGILWIVREAWPTAETFWKVTASFTGFFQCELWRNFPCRASYAMIHPAYRPTRMQLTVPHSPIIDWLPWPDLRDLVIKHQDSIDVDYVCKTAIQNVISHRRSATSRRQPTRGGNTHDQPADLSSFRVWDICLLEKQNNLLPSEPDLYSTVLTYRPQCASVVALQKAYNLVWDDFTTQKLHSAFFETYPFLYCESAASRFGVQDMPAVLKEDVGYPRELDMESVDKLGRLIQRKLGKV
jgi:Domain of unknown function (DUF3425)